MLTDEPCHSGRMRRSRPEATSSATIFSASKAMPWWSTGFDDRQMAIALVINNVDRNLCHLFGKGTGGCKGSTKIGEHLACLDR